MQQQSPAQIYDQFNRTLPLEIGFDRRLSGTAATRLTTPIPALNNYPTMISQPISQQSFGDVVTKSMMPYPQNQIVVNQGVPMVAPSVPTTEKLQDVKPKEKKVKKIVCAGPNGLCYNELNQMLFDLLEESDGTAPCNSDDSEIYGSVAVENGNFKWKYPEEILVRGNSGEPFVATRDISIGYSRYQPAPSNSGDANAKVASPVRVLLIHDILDCRKSWTCAQKMLGPFIDTIAVDLLGSGDSSKPRGLNKSSGGEDSSAAEFPWSYEAHAQYLLNMASFMWPDDKFFVIGAGCGAQIAAVMASLEAESVLGIVMINPVGFHKNAHSGVYANIAQFKILQTEKQLQESSMSFIGCVRSALLESLGSSGTNSACCNKSETIGRLKSLLEQYSDLDRKMVLIEQLTSMAGMGSPEWPRTPENSQGLEVDKIGCSVMLLFSAEASIYGAGHRNIYSSIYYNASVNVRYLASGGHLLHFEHPGVVAEIILDVVRNKSGFASLKVPFVGFRNSGDSDRSILVEGLKSIYGM